MLEPVMNVLESQRIILASSSPRRRDILKNVGLKFTVVPSLYEEDLNPEDFPEPGAFAIATATNKVTEVEQRLRSRGEDFDVIIGADTVVHRDGKVYGKPRSEEEALRVLRSLSGTSHTVHSGVCIRTRTQKTIRFSESTEVFFGRLPDDVLEAYVRTGDPMDKAGGYGIQVRGGTFVERINGDYYNVVGLPLYRLCQHLLELYSPGRRGFLNEFTERVAPVRVWCTGRTK